MKRFLLGFLMGLTIAPFVWPSAVVVAGFLPRATQYAIARLAQEYFPEPILERSTVPPPTPNEPRFEPPLEGTGWKFADADKDKEVRP